MTIPQAVKDWHEHSEGVADAIDAHLKSYPGLKKSDLDSKQVVIHLSTRYTVITGFVPPEKILNILKSEGSSAKDSG